MNRTHLKVTLGTHTPTAHDAYNSELFELSELTRDCVNFSKIYFRTKEGDVCEIESDRADGNTWVCSSKKEPWNNYALRPVELQTALRVGHAFSYGKGVVHVTEILCVTKLPALADSIEAQISEEFKATIAA